MTVTFSDPAMEYISAEAKRLGISKADVVRRIVDEKREANEPFDPGKGYGFGQDYWDLHPHALFAGKKP